MSGHPTTISRASIGTRRTSAGIVSVAANLARLETVPSGPALARTQHGDYTPFAVDAVNRLLRGVGSTGLPLQAVNVADEVTTNIVTAAQLTEVGDVPNLTGVRVSGSTWFLFVRNRIERRDGAKWMGKVFVTTDGGATVTRIHRNHYGGPPNASSNALSADGQRICYGAYVDHAAGVPAGTWLSEDGGANWDAIYDPGDPAAIGRHVHTVRFDVDPNVIWVFTGDTTGVVYGCGILRLTRPAGWHAGDGAWTALWVYDGTKDYTAAVEHGELFNGKVLIHGGAGYSWDPATDLLGRFFDIRRNGEAGANSRYAYWCNSAGIKIHNLLPYGGLLYASGYTYSPGASNGDEGIYASADGKAWTCLMRPAGGLGFRDLVCAWRDRIWCVERTGTSTHVMASFPVASVATVQALRLEAGATNVITGRPDSTFSTVGGTAPTINGAGDATCCHWRDKWWSTGFYDVITYSIIAAGGADDSGHCLRLDNTATGGTSLNALALLNHQAGWHAYDVTATGVRVLLRAMIKAVGPWPQNYGVLIYPFQTIGTIAADGLEGYITPSEDEWLEVRWEGTVTALAGGVANIDVLGIGISCDGREQVARTSSLLVDCVEIRFGTGWPSGDSYVDPLYSPRASESATVSLAGYGLPSGLLFAWRPESGWAEYGAVIPLVTVHGPDGTGSLAVIYTPANEAIGLWNGSDAPTNSTSIKWRHFDELKFALSFAANGTPTLRLYEPAGGVQVITAAELAIGVPIDAHFGVDPAGTGFGAGLFHSFGLRHEAVTAAEFAAVAAMAGWSWNRPIGGLTLTGAQR